MVVFAIYLLATTLTEVVLQQRGSAVVMTPIAIGIGTALGIDPRPLVVAVLFASSAAFATPIGYQTNTAGLRVPGGYKFTDFLRVGVPLNLSLAVIVFGRRSPSFWPL